MPTYYQRQAELFYEDIQHHTVEGISYAEQGQKLINLYNELKKLKGE